MNIDSTILGYDKKTRPVLYSSFKKNISVLRTIQPGTLTPEGAKALYYAKMIDPFIDSPIATLEAASEYLKQAEALN